MRRSILVLSVYSDLIGKVLNESDKSVFVLLFGIRAVKCANSPQVLSCPRYTAVQSNGKRFFQKVEPAAAVNRMTGTAYKFDDASNHDDNSRSRELHGIKVNKVHSIK